MSLSSAEQSVLATLVCVLPIALIMMAIAILGFRLKTWYVDELLRLDSSTRWKITTRPLSFYLPWLLMVLSVLTIGIIWPSLRTPLWGMLLFAAFLLVPFAYGVFEYLEMYGLSKKSLASSHTLPVSHGSFRHKLGIAGLIIAVVALLAYVSGKATPYWGGKPKDGRTSGLE